MRTLALRFFFILGFVFNGSSGLFEKSRADSPPPAKQGASDSNSGWQTQSLQPSMPQPPTTSDLLKSLDIAKDALDLFGPANNPTQKKTETKPADTPPGTDTKGAAKGGPAAKPSGQTGSAPPQGPAAAGASGAPPTEAPKPRIVVIDDNDQKEYYLADQGDPSAVLRTSLGDITIRLFKGRTPLTVEHFLSLAKGDKLFREVSTGRLEKRPFYNGLIFHRVIKDFIIQTGCPFGNGRGDMGEKIADEIKDDLGFDAPGMVAMAPMRDKSLQPAPNTSSSQFFITLRAMPELDRKKFTVFGKVINGMNIVEKISNVRVGPTDRPIKKVTLISVETFDSPPAAVSEAHSSKGQ